MATGLIDPSGHASGAIGSGPAGAGARRGGVVPGTADGLVLDRGFVVLTEAGRGGMRLRLRPARVSGAALARLCFVLADRRPSRVLVAYFADEPRQWRHEMCGDWMAAIRRLETLCAQPRTARLA